MIELKKAVSRGISLFNQPQAPPESEPSKLELHRPAPLNLQSPILSGEMGEESGSVSRPTTLSSLQSEQIRQNPLLHPLPSNIGSDSAHTDSHEPVAVLPLSLPHA